MFIHKCSRQVVAGLVGLLLLLVPLAGCGGNSTNLTPAPLQFVSIDLGLPAKALNSPVVGSVPDNTRIHVVITFKANRTLLNQLKKTKLKPGTSVSLKGLANRIGISDSVYQKIKAFFGVDDVALKLGALHTDLAMDASTGTLARLLRTHFVYHQLEGRQFYAPATAPKLLKFIADDVLAISGLDSFSVPEQPTGTALLQQRTSMSSKQLLLPQVVAHAYAYDAFWKQGFHGENMAVNLVELQGYDPQAVQVYGTHFNFQGQVNAINIDNVPPPPSPKQIESTLDIEMVQGLAPKATINVYQTDQTVGDPFTDYIDVLNQIINDNATTISGNVISISYGLPEALYTPAQMSALDQEFQQLQSEHLTVFVSSGDNGAYSDKQNLEVNAPADDPWVTAVGGTSLTVDTNGNRSNEVVWSDPSRGVGGGGGISAVYPSPAWQSGNGVANQYSDGMREVPDISAVADIQLPVYFHGRWLPVGGTSAAAPIWAVGMILLNQVLIQQQNVIVVGPGIFYQVANNPAGGQPFYDVTSGDNLYYPATQGYDLASGLGTPNLVDFYNAAVNAPTS